MVAVAFTVYTQSIQGIYSIQSTGVVLNTWWTRDRHNHSKTRTRIRDLCLSSVLRWWQIKTNIIRYNLEVDGHKSSINKSTYFPTPPPLSVCNSLRLQDGRAEGICLLLTLTGIVQIFHKLVINRAVPLKLLDATISDYLLKMNYWSEVG